MEEVLRAQSPAGKERFSIVRLAEWWYVACRSHELRRRPIARTILGTPLVLFRDRSGRALALLDRCAHRNLALSVGRVLDDGRLECAYHGWQYDGDGICRVVPALGDGAEGKARRVPAYPVREQQGFVWVYGSPDGAPSVEPFSFPCLDRPGYASVHFDYEVEATLHATLENMLDVPHTAFLHRGLFRGGRRNEIRAVVRRFPDRVEVEYLGEPRPSGLVAKLLAPGSEGTVTHYDRFLLPSISQVEYRLGDSSHLFVCAALTPVADFATRFYAVVSFRLPLPAALVKLLVTPVAKRIFRQDAEILRLQTERIRRFGAERYVSTDVDLLGPHIWRLLKEAEAGAAGAARSEPAVEKEVRLLV